MKVYSSPSEFDIKPLAIRCKIPTKLQLSREGTICSIENPQEWNYGELKFKAFNYDLTAYGLGVKPCISAELK